MLRRESEGVRCKPRGEIEIQGESTPGDDGVNFVVMVHTQQQWRIRDA